MSEQEQKLKQIQGYIRNHEAWKEDPKEILAGVKKILNSPKPDFFCAGVVNIGPLGKDHPCAFFEIDTTDEKVRDYVISVYKKYNIDCVEHRVGKGWHFFGGMVERTIWVDWKNELQHLNPKYPPLTLRISKKPTDSTFERPVYHESKEVLPNWSRALMHYINKEIKGENHTDLWQSMYNCSLEKYWQLTVYPVFLNGEGK